MARANEAYKKGDKAALEQILYKWEHRSEKAPMKEGPADRLSELEKKILQMKKRLQEIDLREKQLMKSDLYKLKRKVERAEREGRDLLGEMEKDLKGKIESAKGLLESLQEQASG
jgi:hypothetical protein